MIGNVFEIGKGREWHEVVTVDRILRNSVFLKGREFPTDIYLLEPIPITKDILLKNGFKRRVLLGKSEYNDEIADYEKEISGFFISFRDTSNTIDRDWFVHIDNCNRCTCGGCDVQYLHQVQNVANVLGFTIDFQV